MKHSTYNIHVFVSIEDFRPQCTASKTGWIWDAFFRDLSQPYLDTGRGIAISKGQSLQLEIAHAISFQNALDSKFYMKCTEESPFLDSLDFRSVLKRTTATMPVQILLRDSYSPNHYCLII